MKSTGVIHVGLRELSSRLPYGMLDRLLRPSLLVGYYHLISDEEVPHIKYLYQHKPVPSFISDLEFILARYTPVGLEDLIPATRRTTRLPLRSFHLTFDDGFSEMATIVAPLLSARGIPATFFLSSAFVDNRALCYQHKASLLVCIVRMIVE
jgi:hypothetical protein